MSATAAEMLDAFRDVLRPVVAELVAEEVGRVLDAQPRPADEEPPYLTVAQYAERHQATPAAVRARIRRGNLEAIKPPGGREYLIPNGSSPVEQAQLPPQTTSPRDAGTSGGVTPKE